MFQTGAKIYFSAKNILRVGALEQYMQELDFNEKWQVSYYTRKQCYCIAYTSIDSENSVYKGNVLYSKRLL